MPDHKTPPSELRVPRSAFRVSRSALPVPRSKVLIVDDEDSIRITLTEFIKDDRYVIHTATDADEALRLMDEVAFDVVVSDIVLPRMNGVALMKEIRKRSPGTQVIMLTGDPTVETAAEAVRAGAFDYLTKPVSQNAIRRVVANAAQVKVLTDEKRRLEEENKKYQEHLEQMVGERTAELRESEGKFRSISANAQEAIIMLDTSGKAIYWNAAAERIFGYSIEEALGMDIHRIIASRKQYEDFEKGFINFHKTAKSRIIGSPLELTGRRKDGTEVPLEMSVSAVRLKGAWNPVAIIRDITARKQAQDALFKSEVRYRATFESTGTAMLIIEEDMTVSLVNEQAVKLSGYSKDEVEGKMSWTELVVKEDLERMKTYHDARRAEGGNAPESYEFRFVTREGKTRDILLTIGMIPGTKRSIASLSDITKLKQAEEAARESEARYRGIVQYQTECIDRWLPDGTLTFVNDAYCQYYGKTRDELIGGKWKDVVVEEEREHMPEYAEMLKTTLTREQPIVTNEHREVAANGEIRWMQWSDQAIFDEQGSLLEFQSVGRDITERKEAQERELRLLQQQIAINKLSLALGSYTSLQEIYDTIYKYVAELIDTDAFYISSYDKNEQLIRAEYVRDEYGHVVDSATLPPLSLEKPGHGTQSQVIRSGESMYIPDILQAMENIEESYNIASDGTVTRDTVPYSEQEDVPRSELLAPMLFRGEVIGVIGVENTQVDVYTQADLDLLAGLANVAAVAIENAHLQEGLKETLEDTIRVVGLAIEMRDPYTARHQERVAELACAIAREMGVPEEQVEGLHAAGLVHDIGKIAIPAEILTKPAKLSSLEYSLIQAHPQRAYDILKDIDFPWPIADFVLQHHERMDGSGYPNGFKGEEILLESRIIAVADVVEAMASHRPYRAAIGLEAALDEIKKNVGRLYDPAVVDACLAVFEKGFTLA